MSRCWKFFKFVGANSLSQVVNETTRKDILLDFLSVSTEGLVGDMRVSCYLGHTDHKFFSVMRKKDSRIATLDIKRVNFKLFKELLCFSRIQGLLYLYDTVIFTEDPCLHLHTYFILIIGYTHEVIFKFGGFFSVSF